MKSNSIAINIFSNYVSQILVAALGIFLLPKCAQYMGYEAYGLVGFYGVAQAWFQFLDLGLSPTLGRQVARYKGGAATADNTVEIFRVLVSIAFFLVLIGAFLVFVFTHKIATNWLKSDGLSFYMIENSLYLMIPIFSLRLLSSLYKSALNGFEDFVWLAKFNSIIAIFRFAVIVPVLAVVSASPYMFFSYQIFISALELLFAVYRLNQLLPIESKIFFTKIKLSGFKSDIKFALSVSITGAVWVAATQTDKLILSKILPLGIYGYFTLAIAAANGILILTNPISNALIPRLTLLHSSKSDTEFRSLYRNGSQLTSVIAAAVVVFIAFFSNQILWVWSGNKDLATSMSLVLTLYVLGNGFLVASSFQYYVQLAHGQMKLHLIFNIVYLMLMIPLLFFATRLYGVVGAGWVWLFLNAATLAFWVPYVHKRYLPGVHFRWLLEDVLSPYVMSTIGALFLQAFVVFPQGRLELLISLIAAGFLLLCFSTFASKLARAKIAGYVLRK